MGFDSNRHSREDGSPNEWLALRTTVTLTTGYTGYDKLSERSGMLSVQCLRWSVLVHFALDSH